jgi:hypothetical protein
MRISSFKPALRAALQVPDQTLIGEHRNLIEAIRTQHAHDVQYVCTPRLSTYASLSPSQLRPSRKHSPQHRTTSDQFTIAVYPLSQIDMNAGAFSPHPAYGTNDQGLNLQDVNYIPGDTPIFCSLKDGFEYDITGMQGQEAWLANILKTWQFN